MHVYFTQVAQRPLRNEHAKRYATDFRIVGKAGIVVVCGKVKETVFDETENTRFLYEGEVIHVPAPYVHLVSACGNLGVTIHAYYPRLEAMNLYEYENSKLKNIGTWEDDRP